MKSYRIELFNWAASGQCPVTLLEPKLDMEMYVLVLSD